MIFYTVYGEFSGSGVFLNHLVDLVLSFGYLLDVCMRLEGVRWSIDTEYFVAIFFVGIIVNVIFTKISLKFIVGMRKTLFCGWYF